MTKPNQQLRHERELCLILSDYGEILFKHHYIDEAAAMFNDLLENVPEGDQQLTAEAFYRLANIASAQGNSVKARQQGEESLTIFETIGHGRASEVRQWLDTLCLATDGNEEC